MHGETFVFFGIVGSGKGTQVKLLMEFLEKKDGRRCVYIGTGEIFRKILESGSNQYSFDAEAVRGILTSGRLMPDEMTNQIVSETVKKHWSKEKHLLFDGYPRTVTQSEYFANLVSSLKLNEVKIIYLELSKEEAMKRNLLRGRDDDTQEGLAKRFDEYINKVVPAMNYFKEKKGYKIFTINGEQSVEHVHQDIINKLHL